MGQRRRPGEDHRRQRPGARQPELQRPLRAAGEPAFDRPADEERLLALGGEFERSVEVGVELGERLFAFAVLLVGLGLELLLVVRDLVLAGQRRRNARKRGLEHLQEPLAVHRGCDVEQRQGCRTRPELALRGTSRSHVEIMARIIFLTEHVGSRVQDSSPGVDLSNL